MRPRATCPLRLLFAFLFAFLSAFLPAVVSQSGQESKGKGTRVPVSPLFLTGHRQRARWTTTVEHRAGKTHKCLTISAFRFACLNASLVGFPTTGWTRFRREAAFGATPSTHKSQASCEGGHPDFGCPLSHGSGAAPVSHKAQALGATSRFPGHQVLLLLFLRLLLPLLFLSPLSLILRLLSLVPLLLVVVVVIIATADVVAMAGRCAGHN